MASLSRRVDQLKEHPVDTAKAAHRVITVGIPRKNRKENLPTCRRYAAPSRERAGSILRHIGGHISNADKVPITAGSTAACIRASVESDASLEPSHAPHHTMMATVSIRASLAPDSVDAHSARGRFTLIPP
ncbi:MAG: hypothetical protein LKK28_03490 [Bifidobacterium crudilactis]|nr:hypothetical protein [Bifidobacterium crudilactis]